jgi:hypothetical protein
LGGYKLAKVPTNDLLAPLAAATMPYLGKTLTNFVLLPTAMFSNKKMNF